MRLRELFKHMRSTGHLMVGIPDYDRYVARRAAERPHEPAMSLSEFQRHCAELRFGGGTKGVSRCC